jgi:hypothetical protein
VAAPDFSVEAVEEDVTIETGATFLKTWTWTVLSDPLDPDSGLPVDITGCTASAKFKEQKDSVSALVSLTNVSGLTLGDAAGTIVMEVTPAQSLVVKASGNKTLFYDVEITFTTGPNSGRVKRYVEGVAHFDWGVSP